MLTAGDTKEYMLCIYPCGEQLVTTHTVMILPVLYQLSGDFNVRAFNYAKTAQCGVNVCGTLFLFFNTVA